MYRLNIVMLLYFDEKKMQEIFNNFLIESLFSLFVFHFTFSTWEKNRAEFTTISLKKNMYARFLEV